MGLRGAHRGSGRGAGCVVAVCTDDVVSLDEEQFSGSVRARVCARPCCRCARRVTLCVRDVVESRVVGVGRVCDVDICVDVVVMGRVCVKVRDATRDVCTLEAALGATTRCCCCACCACGACHRSVFVRRYSALRSSCGEEYPLTVACCWRSLDAAVWACFGWALALVFVRSIAENVLKSRGLFGSENLRLPTVGCFHANNSML